MYFLFPLFLLQSDFDVSFQIFLVKYEQQRNNYIFLSPGNLCESQNYYLYMYTELHVFDSLIYVLNLLTIITLE